MQDPIADMLTSIRNAQAAGKAFVKVPASKLKLQLGKVLEREGYVGEVKYDGVGAAKKVVIDLKYYDDSPVIQQIKRVSRPGLRQYKAKESVPTVNAGLGVAVISTSKGLIVDREARKLGIGGEVLCTVF
jgi:small subunit ribosomal protein S8